MIKKIGLTITMTLMILGAWAVLPRETAQALVTCNAATQFVWDGGGVTDNWNEAANWDNTALPDTVPGTGATVGVDVCIANQIPDITVTHSSGTHSIDVFESDEALEISGGTLNFSGTSQINNTLTISGGLLGGTGTLNVSGLTTFTGGEMRDSGITNLNGDLNISGNPNKGIRARTVNLATLQTATWTGTGGFGIGEGGVFNNNGTFDAQNDATIFNFGSPNGSFNNNGTFTKSAGAGTTSIQVPLNNTGTTEVQTGTLRYTSTYTQTAGITRVNGGSLRGTTTTGIDIRGGILEGQGNIEGDVFFSGGGAAAPGPSTGQFSMTGGNLDFGTGGVYGIDLDGTTLPNFDQINITDAASNLGNCTINSADSDLNVTLGSGFTPTFGTVFPVLNCDIRTGEFATTNFPTFGSLTLAANYRADGLDLEVVGITSVVKALQALIDEVTALNLDAGIPNSLNAKLERAQKALEDMNSQNDVAAVNSLQAFINEVVAQRGQKISVTEADALISTAEVIIALLSG